MARSVSGRVISLDRGFPLVLTAEGELRAQHSIELVKSSGLRAAVGDVVTLERPPGQDTSLIVAIGSRGHTLVRRSLVESRHEGAGKHEEQVLAANIDLVFVVCALSNRRIDIDYLERQLVMAHESGAEVAVVLTKADLATHRADDLARVRGLACVREPIVESAVTGEGLSQVAELLKGGKVGVLLGRSGVGKSTLINEMLGAPLLETGAVRAKDRAGRHVTVARRMVFLESHRPGVSPDELKESQQASEARQPGEAPQPGKARQPGGTRQPGEARQSNGARQPGGTRQPGEARQSNGAQADVAPLTPRGSGAPPVPYGGALIDTPGLRSIGLYDAREGLVATFPDIVAYAAGCRYRDCTHTGEPGCAVVAAVANGHLPAPRLTSYTAIAAEVNA